MRSGQLSSMHAAADSTLKEEIQVVTSVAIDADGSGLVRRAELRSFMSKLSKSIPDGVISGLIAYVDTDGDAKTLSREEFVRMMSEDFLDNL